MADSRDLGTRFFRSIEGLLAEPSLSNGSSQVLSGRPSALAAMRNITDAEATKRGGGIRIVRIILYFIGVNSVAAQSLR